MSFPHPPPATSLRNAPPAFHGSGALAALALVLLAQPVSADDVLATWQGGTGNWNDPFAWSIAPDHPQNNGSTFHAQIESGTVSLTQDVLISELTIQNATLLGPGAITVPTVTWTGGTLGTTLNTSSALSWNGGSLGGVLNNSGTMTLGANLAGDFTQQFGGLGVLNNSGTVDVAGGFHLGLGVNSGSMGHLEINNTGLIKKSQDGETWFLVPINNSGGTIRAEVGQIEFAAGGTLSGLYRAEPGASILFRSDAPFTVDSGARFEGANISFGGGTLSATQPANLQGLNLAWGWVTGTMDLVGASTWNGMAIGGTVNNSGTMTLGANLGGDFTQQFGGLGVLNNSGTIDVAGGFHLGLGVSSGSMGHLEINNTGLIKKSQDGETWFLVPINNSGGTIRAEVGQIEFAAGGTLSGLYRAEPGASILFRSDAPFTVDSGARFEGANISFGGGTLSATQPVNLQGLNLAWGWVTGTMDLVGASTWNGMAIGGTVNNSGTMTLGANLAGDFTQQFGGLGVLNNSGTIDVAGGFHLGHGVSSGSMGHLEINNTGLIKKSQDGETWFLVPINNSGGTIRAEVGCIAITSGGVLSGTYIADPGACILIRDGSYSLAAGTTLVGEGISFANTEIIYSGSQTVGNITLTGGSLAGTGTIVGDVLVQEGSIRPGHSPGQLNINGSLGLGALASVEFELGGTIPGTDHDSILVSGAVVVGGMLQLTMIQGFEEHATATAPLSLITAGGGITGGFSNVQDGGRFATSDGSGSWRVSIATDGGAGKLLLSDFQAVPEPGAWGSLAGSLLALWAFASRRSRCS